MHCLWAATRRACRPCRATSRKARANGFNKPHLYTVLVSVRNSLTLFYMYVQNAVQTHFFPQTGCELCSLSHSKSRAEKNQGWTPRPNNNLSALSGMLLMRMEWRWGSQIIYLVDLIFPYQRTGPTWPEPAENNKVSDPLKKAKNGEGEREMKKSGGGISDHNLKPIWYIIPVPPLLPLFWFSFFASFFSIFRGRLWLFSMGKSRSR